MGQAASAEPVVVSATSSVTETQDTQPDTVRVVSHKTAQQPKPHEYVLYIYIYHAYNDIYIV